MRVKVTFVCNPINVEKSDAELLLCLLESAAYYAPAFPPTYSLHIKEMGFALGCNSYKIHGPLFNEGFVDIAALSD